MLTLHLLDYLLTYPANSRNCAMGIHVSEFIRVIICNKQHVLWLFFVLFCRLFPTELESKDFLVLIILAQTFSSPSMLPSLFPKTHITAP